MGEMHALERLFGLIRILRGEGGCPWDRDRQFQDVVPSIIEEAYELEWANAKGSAGAVLDELGDVLFLLCFAIAILGEKDPSVTVERIATLAYEKIKRRHPHVFEGEKARTKAESLYHWNRIKASERRSRESGESSLSDVPENLPPVKRAERLQRSAATVGFDWPDAFGIVEKLREELDEVEGCLRDGPKEKIREEIGDLFFSVVNLSRFLDLSAESLLERANAKFSDRFRKMEALIEKDGRRLGDLSIEEMDAYWETVKSTR